MKRKYASKSEIPAGLEALYEEQGGAFVLKKFEDEEGDDLKSKLDEFRTNNTTLAKQVEEYKTELGRMKSQFKGVDPDKLRKQQEALSRIEAEEERKLIEQGQIDEVIKRRTASAIVAYEEKVRAKDSALQEAEKQTENLRNRLGRHLISERLQVELNNAGIRPKKNALPDILSRAHSTFHIGPDGEPEPKASDGTTIYGEKGNKLTMSEYVKTHLLRDAAHLIEPARGADSEGSKGSPGTTGDVIRIPRGDLKMKSKYMKELASGKAILVD
jgi:hypothetical protein